MHVGPVIAVTELARARDFYEGKLGLRGRETPGGWVVEADGGTVIYLLPDVPNAGGAGWPVASFRVDDVHATVRRFRAAGVPFLGPDDLPFTLDEDGVSSDTTGLQVAWLKDPDGNILTVFQPAQSS
jgi:catechol 2,3-dioxygenase-like lactoylglutathione lyase family enzyme